MYAIFCRGEFVVIQGVVVGVTRRVDGTVIDMNTREVSRCE